MGGHRAIHAVALNLCLAGLKNACSRKQIAFCRSSGTKAALRNLCIRMLRVLKPRSTLSQEGGVLRITIPATRHWGLLLFFTCWMIGWYFGEAHAVREIQSTLREGRFPNPFLLAWSAMWTLFGLFFGYTCLWQLTGRDEVTVRDSNLSLRKRILRLGWTRTFVGSQVRDLRFSPETGAGRSHRYSRVSFDYGAKTYSFAEGVEEAEARQLLLVLWRHLPAAAPKSDAITEVPQFWQLG